MDSLEEGQKNVLGLGKGKEEEGSRGLVPRPRQLGCWPRVSGHLFRAGREGKDRPEEGTGGSWAACEWRQDGTGSERGAKLPRDTCLLPPPDNRDWGGPEA